MSAGPENVQPASTRGPVPHSDGSPGDRAADTLRQSDEFLRQLVDSVHGVVVYDTELRYALWNSYMQEISGLSEAEVLGNRPSELFPWARDAGVEEVVRQALGGSIAVVDDVRFEFPKTGRQGWSSVRYYPLRDRSNRVIGAIGNVIDTTAWHLARQERDRLAQIIEETTDLVGIADPEGRIQYINPGGRRMLGLGAKEDLSKREVPSLHAPATVGHLVNVIFPTVMREGVWRGESNLLAADGREIPVSQVVLAHRSRAGELEYMSTVVRDLTEIQQAARALGESEELARVAFAAAHIGGFDWQVASDHARFFGNMMALFGRPANEEHKNFAEFLMSVHPDDRLRVKDAVRQSQESGRDYEIEFRTVWPDGSVHWLAERAVVYHDANGTPMRMVGVTLDIDERKRSEAQREQLDTRVQEAQKLETLGTLAGGVAHDFNNLLQVILSNAALLRLRSGSSPDVRTCLDQIETATQQASELTGQLLAYAGKGRVVVEVVDVTTLVLEMSKLLEVSLLKSAVIQAQFPPGIPSVDGDPSQLRQVVMNLLLNAAEALPDARGVIRVGTGNLRLSTRELSQMSIGAGLPEGSYTYFEVCDTGCGMTPEVSAKIFDPFFTTKNKGRGLGLAAVLGIVRGHRGALQVESAPGLGTILRVFLPASSGTAAQRTSAPQEIAAATRMCGTVLVVDDEPAIRKSATLLLQALGFKVLTAGDGREAIDRFQENQNSISAVILDLTMPHVSGAEAFRELRQMRGDLPILITSGYAEEDIVGQFRESGPVSFIQKPYRGSDLLSRLLGVLNPART